jgi:HlyD family secretion protein
MTPQASEADFGLARYRRAGLVLIAGLAVVILGWGAVARIAGAVIAPGQVVVESSPKQVQHREGGIIADLLVREGQEVQAGQVLIRLESVVTQASADTTSDQFMELTARRMRLEAERDGRGRLAIPAASSPAFLQVLAAEQRLLTTRAAARAQQHAQIREQILQSEEQVRGSQAQAAAIASQIDLMQGELTGMRQLYAKGLAPLGTLNNLERQDRYLAGEKERLAADISRVRAHISEIRLQGVQADSDFLAGVMSELKDANLRLAQISEQKASNEDLLRRDEIRAPAAGKVTGLAVHTRGGVIAPGQTLMHIVPQKDALVVDAQISPQNIDQVKVGAKAIIRFTAFTSYNTPEVVGRIVRVSADAQRDERTGQAYYIARAEFGGKPLPKSVASRLTPGMPAEVHIQTGSRSALSYFLRPLTDQMARTFREE